MIKDKPNLMNNQEIVRQTEILIKGNKGEHLVTKKHMKSKEMKDHKKPMDPDILEEEFGSELGDINSSKWIDTLVKPKKDAACQQNKK